MDTCPSMPFEQQEKMERDTASITVVCRKRPLLANEIANGDRDHVMLDGNEPNKMIVFEPRKDITGAQIYQNHEYEFDRIYAAAHKTEMVYMDCVKPLVERFKERGGKNSIFTYGQTGSGKSYSMLGCPSAIALADSTDYIPEEQKGFMQYSIHDMFRGGSGIWLRLSCFEIYNNKVYDLLNDRRNLRPLECRSGEIAVHELTFEYCSDPQTVLDEMHSALRTRKTNSNLRNKTSSRGHMVCQLEMVATQPDFINGGKVTVPASHQETKSDIEVARHPRAIHGGRFAFIDLAGTERTADSCQITERVQTNGESATINKSLLALKECFRAIDAGSNHVPFRDSQLTKVLREYLVPVEANTLMMVHVSPGKMGLEGAVNALHYASMVRALRKRCKALLDAPPPPPTEAELVFKASKDPLMMTSNGVGEMTAPPPRKRRGNSSLPSSMATLSRNSTSLVDKRRKALSRNSEGSINEVDNTTQSRIENFLPTPPRRSSLGPASWAPMTNRSKSTNARVVPPTPRVWSSPTPGSAPPCEPKRIQPSNVKFTPRWNDRGNMSTSADDIQKTIDQIYVTMTDKAFNTDLEQLQLVYTKCGLEIHRAISVILKQLLEDDLDRGNWLRLFRQAMSLEGRMFASLTNYMRLLEGYEMDEMSDEAYGQDQEQEEHKELFVDATY